MIVVHNIYKTSKLSVLSTVNISHGCKSVSLIEQKSTQYF